MLVFLLYLVSLGKILFICCSVLGLPRQKLLFLWGGEQTRLLSPATLLLRLKLCYCSRTLDGCVTFGIAFFQEGLYGMYPQLGVVAPVHGALESGPEHAFQLLSTVHQDLATDVV